jgi:hypothetical protein
MFANTNPNLKPLWPMNKATQGYCLTKKPSGGKSREAVSQRDSVTKIIVAPIATKKIIVLRIATVKSLIWERIAKGLFLLWQTAAHLRAVCLLVILVVVNRGIGAHLPKKSEIYLQVILHPQSPVSVAVSFYVRLYTCKTYTRRIV